MDNDIDDSIEDSEATEQLATSSLIPANLKVKRSMDINEFSKTIVIKRRGKSAYAEKISVPIDSLANKAAQKFLVAKLSNFYLDVLDKYQTEGRVPEPKQLADIASAAKSITELSYRAYGDTDGKSEDSNSSMMSGLGKIINNTISATAEAVREKPLEVIDTIFSKVDRQRLNAIEEIKSSS